MIEEFKVEFEKSMQKVVESLRYQLTKVRTGRASASALDGIMVDYYGSQTPISQVGQISTPESRLLQIQPFDRSMIASIEKAILASNLGATPSNDGNLIRIPFPSLTEERRREKVREIKKMGEEAKIAIRNNRRIQNESIKKREKDKEISKDDSKKKQDEVQKITDEFILQVGMIIESKENELLSI